MCELIGSARVLLARLELAEFSTFEQNLECSPDERCGCLRTVDRVVSEGEAGTDGLINVYHCARHPSEQQSCR